jgi:hypothetical protein
LTYAKGIEYSSPSFVCFVDLRTVYMRSDLIAISLRRK